MKILKLFFLVLFITGFVSVSTSAEKCRIEKNPTEAVQLTDGVKHLPWSRKAVIYEVNIRQYTPEGTFKAFAPNLQRLHDMGVDILWFMPINPISVKNRKGPLGSYYSVADYLKVNPEYGTLDDFKAVVKKAHQLGMKVIVDWVANHTGWDNPWITAHPEWYTHNEKGEIVPPVPDWLDTADLNYDNQEMRRAMINAMKYWIQEADIDGFRCDVAGMVPVDFWNEARKQLDTVKPVFMLAEAWEPQLSEKAFDMVYGWDLLHLMNDMYAGKKKPADLDKYFAHVDSIYNPDAYIMNFISNHDENSWNGTEYERMGSAVKAFSVLTFTAPGMPLIYSGQEASLKHRLKFFEKDTISWKDLSMQKFYKQLTTLRKSNPALFSGTDGGMVKILTTTQPDKVFAFSREKKGNKVVVVLNLSKSPVNVQITNLRPLNGKDYFAHKPFVLNTATKLVLPAWGYKVVVY
ncbi:MAG: alpha-amylase family glycosyl hydrolase [Bacteroidota bacterium]|nr:alpha-amylase family glycosyl hydrolase [Bacteroidota bacterium]